MLTVHGLRTACDHIRETLGNLQFLRVSQRVFCKMNSLARCCLRGSDSEYHTSCLTIVSLFNRRSHLRSSDRGDLVISRTRTVRAGGSYIISGPVGCRSLTSHLRDSELSDSKFVAELKTYLIVSGRTASLRLS